MSALLKQNLKVSISGLVPAWRKGPEQILSLHTWMLQVYNVHNFKFNDTIFFFLNRSSFYGLYGLNSKGLGALILAENITYTVLNHVHKWLTLKPEPYSSTPHAPEPTKNPLTHLTSPVAHSITTPNYIYSPLKISALIRPGSSKLRINSAYPHNQTSQSGV